MCPECLAPLCLLVQVYAPLTSDNPHIRSLSTPHPKNAYRDEFDRLLYVFACVKKGCTGIRCLRAARRNDGWAREGRQSRKRKKMEHDKKAKAKEDDRARNPFATASHGASVGVLIPVNIDLTDAKRKANIFSGSNPFASGGNDFGSMIFGSSQEPEEAAPSPEITEDTGYEAIAVDVTNPSTAWAADSAAGQAIPPRYIATSNEELSSAPSTSKYAQLARQMAGVALKDSDDAVEPKEKHKGGRTSKASGKAKETISAGGDGEGWSAEAYEIMKLSGVEEVFLAFQERLELSNSADQVFR